MAETAPTAANGRDEVRKSEATTEAVASAFGQHAKAVFNYCLRMTGTAAVAEELTQETFTRLIGHIERLEDADHIRGWLFRTASNLAVSRSRKARVWTKVQQVIGMKPALVAAIDPAEAAEVQRALLELPEGYRTVLVLHDVAGMTHKEIARARNCSEGTAKSQLVRARAKLAKLLEATDDVP